MACGAGADLLVSDSGADCLAYGAGSDFLALALAAAVRAALAAAFFALDFHSPHPHAAVIVTRRTLLGGGDPSALHFLVCTLAGYTRPAESFVRDLVGARVSMSKYVHSPVAG